MINVWREIVPFLCNSPVLYIFNIFGLLFFLRGIQKAPVSIVVPVSALKVFTILTAVFVVGEVWKMPYLYAFVLSTGGLLFLYLEGSAQASSTEQKTGVLYGLASSFFWGSSYALYTYPIQWWGPLGFSFVIETTAMLFGLVLIIRDGLLSSLYQLLQVFFHFLCFLRLLLIRMINHHYLRLTLFHV